MVSLTAACCLVAAGCSSVSSTRAGFRELIEPAPVPLAAEVEMVSNAEGLVQWRYVFTSVGEERVPGFILKRSDTPGRRPAVIALHGTGGSKQNVLALARKLVNQGFVAVVMDAPHHGERITTGRGLEQYHQAIVRAWREGGAHPLYYDTVRDVMRLVDYLATRDDVDAKRIGLIGISKGGIETYLAAAADQRIAVAVPIIGVQSFRWGLENDHWQGRLKTIQSAFDAVATERGVTTTSPELVKEFYDRVVPGIYDRFDAPALLPLIAPRPLLVINGDSDPHTPLPGVMQAAAAAEQAYQLAGVAERFQLRVQENTGHQVRPESEQAAIDWLVKWLKP